MEVDGKRGRSRQPSPEPKVSSSLHHHLIRLSLLQQLLLVVSYLQIPIHIIVNASYSHLSPVPLFPSTGLPEYHYPTQDPPTRQSADSVSHRSRPHSTAQYSTSPTALSWTQRRRRTRDSRITLVVPTARSARGEGVRICTPVDVSDSTAGTEAFTTSQLYI